MSLITGSHQNSAWSVFDAKRERYIDEVLTSPMSDLQIALAYSLGGTLRGLIMGLGVFLVGVPFVGVTVEHPGLLLLIGVLSSFTFASLGTNGRRSGDEGGSYLLPHERGDPTARLSRRRVLLGRDVAGRPARGDALRSDLHMVDAARYATLRTSDLNPYPTLSVVLLLAALAFGGAWWAINRGSNLRY
jgi:ABC-2 type transport system permease protein